MPTQMPSAHPDDKYRNTKLPKNYPPAPLSPKDLSK